MGKRNSKSSLFGSLFSFDTFNVFSDAIFATGEALRFAKRQCALQEQIGALLDENMAGVTPEKHKENTEKIQALLVKLKQ